MSQEDDVCVVVLKNELHFLGRQRKEAYSRQRDCTSKGMLCHVGYSPGNGSISTWLVQWGMTVRWGWGREEERLERKDKTRYGGP